MRITRIAIAAGAVLILVGGGVWLGIFVIRKKKQGESEDAGAGE
jgi:hypothetical protein